MADRVLTAAAPLPVAVVCDDDEVAAWAESRGARVLWRPGHGLNGAVNDAVATLAGEGVDRVMVTHADLPLATGFDELLAGDLDGVVLVPDRHEDGTNVVVVPAGCRLHVRLRAGLVRPPLRRGRAPRPGADRAPRRRRLTWDVDVPADLDLPPDLADDARCSPRDDHVDQPAGPGAGAGHRRPPRRRRVQLRRAPSPSGRRPAAWSTTSSAPTGRRARGTRTRTWTALVALRQDEQRAAARAARARPARSASCGWVDGELEVDAASGGATSPGGSASFRPDVVLAHDPWKRYRIHPDHRAAGFLACDGIVAARDPHFFPEHDVDPWRPTTLLLFEADEPDHVEDVTDWTEPKLAALECHESQFETTMHKDLGEVASESEAFRDRERQQMAEMGAARRLPPRRSLQAGHRPLSPLAGSSARVEEHVASVRSTHCSKRSRVQPMPSLSWTNVSGDVTSHTVAMASARVVWGPRRWASSRAATKAVESSRRKRCPVAQSSAASGSAAAAWAATRKAGPAEAITRRITAAWARTARARSWPRTPRRP